MKYAGEEEEEQGADFEMLDLLCDAVEADDYQESKKKELKMMTDIMD